MKFIAHRGYSARWNENTIPAFKATIEHQFFSEKKIIGIELDIQLTADEKVIVFHDVKIEINGTKTPVAQIDYKTLCSLNLPRYKTLAGFSEIPLFSDVLDLISHKTALYVEIKNGCYDINSLMASLKKLLKIYKPAKDIIIHSFSIEIMKLALKELSFLDVDFGFLCDDKETLAKADNNFLRQMDYLHPEGSFLLSENEQFLQYAKPLNIWTVDDIDKLNKLEKSKCSHLINAVMTNDLELIREWEKK